MADSLPEHTAGFPLPPDTLPALLDLLPNGVVYYTPVCDAAGLVVDLTFAYLNPAAQTLLRLPPQPAATYRQQFGTAPTDGGWAFHEAALRAGAEPHEARLSYPAAGYFRAAGRRLGAGLLVTYTPELVPVAEPAVEPQQALLSQILGQVPAALATLTGPKHRYTFFNDTYQALVGGRARLGQPVSQVLSEAQSQGFLHLLDQVYATGQPYTASAMPVLLEGVAPAPPQQYYFDLVYQPLRTGQGQVQGILAFIIDVTDRVLARQQAESLQAELLATAQRRVRERDELLQLFEQAPVAIALLREPDHRIDYFNSRFAELFPGTNLKGRKLLEAYPDFATPNVIARLNKVFASGETFFGTEVKLPSSSDEAPRYITFTYQAYHEHGSVAGIAVFIYEVTELVLARREADRQQQLLHNLFTTAPAAIAILDGPAYIYQFINPDYQAFFPGRELLGKPLYEAVPELLTSPIPGLLDQVYQTGEPYVAHELPLQLLRGADGGLQECFFTFTYQARRDTHDAITGIIVFAFEVTDQVLARRNVEAAAQQLRLLTDALPVLISYLDHEQRYQFVNQGYQRWFNRNPVTMLGQLAVNVLGETAYQAVRGYIERALAGERLTFETNMPYRDNFVRYIHTDYIPDIQDGEVRGFYSLITDLTEQHQAHEREQALNAELHAANLELGSANRRLTRTNADLDTFVYAASHDLKAPIANIEGLLTALQEQLPPEVLHDAMVQRLLALMHDSVMRFQQTVAHLTSVSQLEQPTPASAEPVDLAGLVEAVRLDLAPAIEAAGGQLLVDVRAAPQVEFAAKNLRSIIYNLLSNAFKYCAPERLPVVQLRSYHTDGGVQIEVQDNGLGLSSLQQTNLFHMFRRLHTHVAGSGVGLYLVKKIIENAGGTIAVASEPGVGSVFTVYLPQ